MLALVCLPQLAFAQNIPTGWSYDVNSSDGPNNWVQSWPNCGGDFQSPIDIKKADVVVDPSDENLNDLVWTGAGSSTWAFNDTITQLCVAEYDAGDVVSLEFMGTTYELRQVRFHTPAEHKLDGVAYSGEIEYVMESAGRETLSYSVMVHIGEQTNTNLPTFQETGLFSWDPVTAFPVDQSYYTYMGSSSTPICEQASRRVIASTGVTWSREQLANLEAKRLPPTARPTQPFDHMTENERRLLFHRMTNATMSQSSTCVAWSTFDTNTEGWGAFGHEAELAQTNTMVLQGTSVSGENPYYFTAPLPFRGDLHHLYPNGVLRFIIKSGLNDGADAVRGDGDVIIKGYRADLFYRFSANPNQGGYFWGHNIPFNTATPSNGQWMMRARGTSDIIPATQEVMQDVLRYVAAIKIRGSYAAASGVREVTMIDDVYLCDGPHPRLDCPGRTQCNSRGVCRSDQQCDCNHGWSGEDCGTKDRCAVGTFALPNSNRDWKGVTEHINPIVPNHL